MFLLLLNYIFILIPHIYCTNNNKLSNSNPIPNTLNIKTSSPDTIKNNKSNTEKSQSSTSKKLEPYEQSRINSIEQFIKIIHSN